VGKRVFKGRQAEIFASTKDFCEWEPRSEFAVAEGLPADSSIGAIAHAYASEWPDQLRTAAFEGCKAGLAKVPLRFPASSPEAQRIWGRNFIVTSVAGGDEDPPVTRPIHIRFFFSGEREHGIGWQARCNSFGGEVHFTAANMEVSEFGGTLVGCEPEIEKEDAWLSDFLQGNPEWELDGERLWLRSDSSTLELTGFEDPNVCPISPSGGWIDPGDSGFGCEDALNLVALYLEGKDGYYQSWNCRDAESADGLVRVVCREKKKSITVQGFDLGAYRRG
jgi:heat shock protein HslJ